MDITEAVERPRRLSSRAAPTRPTQTSREAIAAELEQLIEGIKQTANTNYRGSFLFSGTETSTSPVSATSTPYVPADDIYQGDDAGWNPHARDRPRDRPERADDDHVVGQRLPRRRPGAADDKLLHVLRDAVDHLRSGDGASLRGTDLDRLDTDFDHLLEVRAANGAKTNRLEAALGRLSQLEESVLGQLSKTEDADIAETLIDLNSQTAAYQAALRAGASIVQTSLMDFLR